MKIVITKNINPAGLLDAIHAAHPEWSIDGLGPDGVRVEVGMNGDQIETALIVPDEADRSALEAVLEAHDASLPANRDVFRGKVVTLAQSAVGVRLQDLTAAQIKALMAALLFRAGAVDPATMQVNPLSDWM